MEKTKISDEIKKWLDEKRWKYHFDPVRSIINVNVVLGCNCASNKVRLIVDIREDFYLAYVILPVRCSENLAEMLKFLAMVNFGMINGNFEVDVHDGEIRYKTYVNCDKMESLPAQIVADSIICACVTVKRYACSIARICECADGATAESEIERSEGG